MKSVTHLRSPHILRLLSQHHHFDLPLTRLVKPQYQTLSSTFSQLYRPTPLILKSNFASSSSFFGEGPPPAPNKTQEKSKDEISLQKYLKKFLLKVHPDFFHRFPDVQKINSESLQLLNNLLDSTSTTKRSKSLSTQNDLSKLPPIAHLRFKYIANGEDNFGEVNVKLEMNVTDLPISQNEQRAYIQQKLLDGIYNLVSGIGIQVPKNERWDSEIKPKLTLHPAFNPKGRETNNVKDKWAAFEMGIKSAKINDREALIEAMRGYLSYARLDKNQLLKEKEGEFLEEGIDKELVFYTPNLSPIQRDEALNSLLESKKQIDARLNAAWLDLPLLVTEKEWEIESAKGFLTFPWNFQVNRLVEHFKSTIAKVRADRDSIRENILKIASVRKQVIRALDLNNIGVNKTLPAVQSASCIVKLTNVKVQSRLASFNLSELNLYVDTKYAVKEKSHGFSIPYNFEIDQLCEFLSKVNLNELRDSHKTSRKHVNRVKKFTEYIKNVLKAENVEFSEELLNLRSKKEQTDILLRLKQQSELFSRTSHIKNWSLIISDRYEEDKEKMIKYIPDDFTANEMFVFLRYGVNGFRIAKPSKLDKMMKQLAEQKRAARRMYLPKQQ